MPKGCYDMPKFTEYNPPNWSGMPEDLSPNDLVEVKFVCCDEVVTDRAKEFGWNRCDIMAYRAV